MTLMFRMVEFERTAFAAYRQAHPDQWRGVHGLWDLVRQATLDGELALAREDILFFGSPHEHELSVNSTRVTGALGPSVWDLTRAERQAPRQMRRLRPRGPGPCAGHPSCGLRRCAMATGQAAGAAGGPAARAGRAVRAVPVGGVQTGLRRQGAAL